MKRPLFVFAGQSNMMGAAVYEASEQIYFKNSFEYLHKPRRFSKAMGEFKDYGFPSGEFSYKDLDAAYGNNKTPDYKSDLDVYRDNTYFCPSMSNLLDEKAKTVHPFSYFSEANNRQAVTLAPFIVKGLEEKGFCCAYAHITRGGMPIKFILEGEAEEYFHNKVKDFFTDCETSFADDDTSDRVLVWLQGESDAKNGYEHYCKCLKELWDKAQNSGFTKLFIVRVDYFGSEAISEIMRAQEDFCRNTENAFIITRVASYLAHPLQSKNWCLPFKDDEFSLCRDSFYGFNNHHINEKGFKVIAKYAVPNIIRILFENNEPVLEEEKVAALL